MFSFLAEMFSPDTPISDKVTFCIAVAGFALSLINFIGDRIANRKHVEVTIKHTHYNHGSLYMLVLFTNRSRFAISITSGCLSFGEDIQHIIGEKSRSAFTYSNPALSGKTVEYTRRFPVRLEPLSAEQCLFEIETWKNGTPLSCSARFGSSRGIVKARLQLPNAPDTLKTYLQRIK